jgi:hypothetical protein
MMSVPLQQLPNQSFSILLDGNQWNFLLKTANDVTVCSLTLNGTDLLDSALCVVGSFIIPCEYQEAGNFFFVTQNQQLPTWTEFTVSQALIYISQTELDALRVPYTYPLTSAFFNPLAALPLRFAPMNYVLAA